MFFLIFVHFSLLTLFPDFFTSPLGVSILEKAKQKDVFSCDTLNIRDFSENKHKTVDDTPYGGMPGMLMQADPVAKAIVFAKCQNSPSEVIFFAPTGKPFTQKVAQEKAKNGKDKIFLCGHYEGIDQRVLDTLVDETYSVGSAVLTGGEIPALYALDAIVRLLPGSIGSSASHEQETFSDEFFGKGEYPQYTRPEVWNGLKVPEVLLSGNHADIEDWKLKNLQGLSEIEEKVLFVKKKVFSPTKIKKYKRFGIRLPSLLDDVDSWVESFLDPEVTQYITVPTGMSKQQELKFLTEDSLDLQSLTLSAVDMKTKKVFANFGLRFSGQFSHIAQFGIVLQKSHWGRGLATDLTVFMVDFAFEHFPFLQKIQLEVYAQNIVAQKVYEKAGFEKVGLLKNHVLKEEKYYDVFLYEKLKDISL